MEDPARTSAEETPTGTEGREEISATRLHPGLLADRLIVTLAVGLPDRLRDVVVGPLDPTQRSRHGPKDAAVNALLPA